MVDLTPKQIRYFFEGFLHRHGDSQRMRICQRHSPSSRRLQQCKLRLEPLIIRKFSFITHGTRSRWKTESLAVVKHNQKWQRYLFVDKSAISCFIDPFKYTF